MELVVIRELELHARTVSYVCSIRAGSMELFYPEQEPAERLKAPYEAQWTGVRAEGSAKGRGLGTPELAPRFHSAAAQ